MRRVLVVSAAVLFSWAALASSISVTTDPKGAIVQLDGVAQGPAPVTIAKVAAGTHQIKVWAEGYEPRVETIYVSNDQDVQVHAPLSKKPEVAPPSPAPVPAPVMTKQIPAPAPVPTPAPAPAPQKAATAPLPLPVSQLPVAWGTQKKTLVLMVDTTPVGASVQVVGMPGVKPSPATFTGFSKGTVTLRVSSPGYQEKLVAVDLTGDARTHVALDRAP